MNEQFKILLRLKDKSPGEIWALLRQDAALRDSLTLNASMFINICFAVFYVIVGIISKSPWFWALGFYYALLSGLRFFLIISMSGSSKIAPDRAYRLSAVSLILLTLAMVGVFVQTILTGRAFSYKGILIYAMAVYAFAKIILVLRTLLRRRKSENRLQAAAGCVSFAGALMSMLALQTALIDTFGKAGGSFSQVMNSISGAVYTMALIALSVYMLARGGKPEGGKE